VQLLTAVYLPPKTKPQGRRWTQQSMYSCNRNQGTGSRSYRGQQTPVHCGTEHVQTTRLRSYMHPQPLQALWAKPQSPCCARSVACHDARTICCCHLRYQTTQACLQQPPQPKASPRQLPQAGAGRWRPGCEASRTTLQATQRRLSW
jgi:hypothetical protein